MCLNFNRLFAGWSQDPDPNNPELTRLRDQQWRPFSQNPFRVLQAEEQEHEHAERRALEREREGQEADAGAPEDDPKAAANGRDVAPGDDGNMLTNPGPTWVHLFYDLAWTATFTNLTQNGKFIEPWDTMSYTAFFIVVWWLWASQALYTIHFYTNDWFHFIFNFIQLLIFGTLAATTRGFDVSTYIRHSPGKLELDNPPPTTDLITDPKIYRAERTAKLSLEVIAFAVGVSRIILLIQYLRVLFHAYRITRKNHVRIPRRLCIVPLALLVSIVAFTSAGAVSKSKKGKTVLGAGVKFGLWAIGLLIEIVSHIQMSRLNWHDHRVRAVLPVPRSNVTLAERLRCITTIILGEGINSIAGTLYAVISAPGLEDPVVSNIVCSALIVYFITYLYFEGPTGDWDPEDQGHRQISWLFLHLPFLLGIVLLLLEVKNQFLLTSFLSAAVNNLEGLNDLFKRGKLPIGTPGLENNLEIKNYMLRRGITWKEVYNQLLERIGPITGNGLNDTQQTEYVAWNGHLSLNLVLKTYEASFSSPRRGSRFISSVQTFMGADRISGGAQSKIQQYLNGTLWPNQIVTELLHTHLTGARYIVAFAGGVLICLSLLNLVHSRPQDRFQWGITTSRFTMGLILVILLLLNVGRYQTLWVFDVSHQAGVFRWLSVYWVLPTLAFAFGLEMFVEIIITWLATLRTAETVRAIELAREDRPPELLQQYVRPSLWSLAWHSIKGSAPGAANGLHLNRLPPLRNPPRPGAAAPRE